MNGLCRAAKSCKAVMVLGALRITCVMVCARLPDSTQMKKIQDALWSAMKGEVAFGITIDVPPYSNPYVLFGLALANAFHLLLSSLICCSKLPSEATVVTAYNLRRTNRGVSLNFKELRYGRIKNDDRRASGLGAHLLDYVLWVSPGMSQT